MKKKRVFVVAIAVVLVLVLLVLVKMKFDEKEGIELNESQIYCESDLDCVPKDCCHSTSCVSSAFAPSCTEIRCTQSCEAGTLDCGQGSCLCVDNKCNAVMK